MPFNSGGLFSRIYSWATDSANGINITDTRMDAEFDGIATALSTCILKDGTQTLTANIPFSGYKITGYGSTSTPSARTDVPSMGQVQDGKINWVDGGGTADAITATYAPAITALVDGQICYVRATAANATTTPTFAPNGLTARTIVKTGGVALAAGDIVGDGHELILRYDLANTRWELLNPKGGSGDVSGPASATADALVLFNGTGGKTIKDSGYIITAAGAALLDDANAAAQRTTLGLVIGTNVLAPNGDGSALTGVSAVDQTARDLAVSALARTSVSGATVCGPIVTFVADTDNYSTKTNATFDTDHYTNAPSVTLGTAVQANEAATPATTHTFSGIAIGDAATNRLVAVIASSNAQGGAGPATVASITVGGVSAVQKVAQAVGGVTTTEMWVAEVPTGTTADIVVTFGGSCLCGIGVFPIYNASTTLADSATDDASPLSQTIDCPAGGAIIAGCNASGGDTLSWAWTGITERYDQEWSTQGHSGASGTFAAAQTGLTITATATGTANSGRMVVASFSPLVAPNMTLSDDAVTLDTANPTDAHVYVLETTVDASPTRRIRVSIDGASTWATATLAATQTFGSQVLYRYEADLSAQTGTTIKVEYNSLDDGKERDFYAMYALPLYA